MGVGTGYRVVGRSEERTASAKKRNSRKPISISVPFMYTVVIAHKAISPLPPEHLRRRENGSGGERQSFLLSGVSHRVLPVDPVGKLLRVGAALVLDRLLFSSAALGRVVLYGRVAVDAKSTTNVTVGVRIHHVEPDAQRRHLLRNRLESRLHVLAVWAPQSVEHDDRGVLADCTLSVRHCGQL